MASVTLWPYSAEILFLFRICRGLRAAPNALSRIESLPKTASLLRNGNNMPFAVTAPLPVKKETSRPRRAGLFAKL